MVLDNCEHLVAGVAALVDRVLRRAGGVAVLATSREALEVAGEVAWRIPPLAVPRAGGAATPIEGVVAVRRGAAVRRPGPSGATQLPSYR